MTTVYVNGQYLPRKHATIGAEDRAANFSDGIYEVVLIKHGVMIDEEAHQKRLERSLKGLRIAAPMTWNALRVIVRRLLRVNGLLNTDAALYLQVSRGVAKRDHPFPKYAVPSVFAMVSRIKPLSKAAYQNGGKAITTEDLRWLGRDIKTISLLPNILAKQEAVEAGVTEAILVEKDGTVTEGSATNVFIVTNEGALLTHPADRHILSGITRAGVIEVAKEADVKVRERCFDVETLKKAKEIFITSTTKHVFPIVEVDGTKIGDGKVGSTTKTLIKAYEAYVNQQWMEQCKQR